MNSFLGNTENVQTKEYQLGPRHRHEWAYGHKPYRFEGYSRWQCCAAKVRLLVLERGLTFRNFAYAKYLD